MSAWFQLCTEDGYDNGCTCCRMCRRNPSRRENERRRKIEPHNRQLPYRVGNHCRNQIVVNRQEEDAA